MFTMLEKLQTHWAENPGALLQLGLCVLLFAACYLFSRLVRYKLAPWLVKKSEIGRAHV